MARIDQGNALSTAMLQPGAKFQTDGYGLVTGTLVFKEDQGGSSAFLARGSACPVSAFSFTKVHKATTSLDALGLATYTVDYVGISAADAGSSTITKPQITGSQGLASENITAHPNFFSLATGFTGSPIAGVGTGTTSPNVPIYATVSLSGGGVEYEGNNGSRFQEQNGNKFLGFKKAQYPGYYGKTNYLAPTSSFSGHFYTTDAANVTGLRDRVGKSSGTNQFNSIKLVPDYVGTVFVNGTKNQLLLAQISFEDFGSLYKVQYEVRYNREGYEPETYALSP
jgi:hypothetical protein